MYFNGILMDFNIGYKITPGMELFEHYFTEQHIIFTRTKEGHEKDYTNLNFSLQNSCTPQVLNDIRTANVHNRPS